MDVLASPLLVASDEMTLLGPADRHPAPSQKLPTSKQPTPPAAPASAPPLSSASIAPNPLFLNLVPMNPPSQTGDSNLVADKTINSSHKEVVPQQQGHSLLPLPIDVSGQPLLSQESTPSPTVQVPIAEVGEKAVLEDRKSTLRSQYRCQSTGSARRQYLRDGTSRFIWTLLGRAVASHVQVVTRHGWRRTPSSGVSRSAVSVSSGHRQSTTMASFTLLLLLAFPLLLLLPLLPRQIGRAPCRERV